MSWEKIVYAEYAGDTSVESGPPRNEIVLLGSESDPFWGDHHFDIDIGWRQSDGTFYAVLFGQTCWPSHWAPIESPIYGAPISVDAFNGLPPVRNRRRDAYLFWGIRDGEAT